MRQLRAHIIAFGAIAFIIAANVHGHDCEVAMESLDIAGFMPVLAGVTTPMQEHDRRSWAEGVVRASPSLSSSKNYAKSGGGRTIKSLAGVGPGLQ